jgi:pyruvate dehydrogenase E2 component (dihydrolipoamide acetyltransferase)
VAIETLKVPDIGGADSVDVIEISVAVGDRIEIDSPVLVLESDKASMDIPSSKAGVVTAILVKVGDKVSESSPILTLETEAAAESAAVLSDSVAPSSAPSQVPVSAASRRQPLVVPDIGGAEAVDVIEVCVQVGASVSEGESLLVLESDKASMEIPSPSGGVLVSLSIKVGDKVSAGSVIGELEVASAEVPAAAAPKVATPASAAKGSPVTAAPAVTSAPVTSAAPVSPPVADSADVYAGPAVRKLARQLGVDLAKVRGQGARGRITQDDVHAYVKSQLQTMAVTSVVGAGIPPVPGVDFAKFGSIELIKMSKIKKMTAANMSRNWLNVPHVTQFDDVDITALEDFRKNMKDEAEKAGVKLTPVPFLLKAAAAALRAEPCFNVSMHADGEHIVQKHYVHIGVAVDTPAGLMVPVLRDVDKKGLFQIATELTDLAKKAREGKLLPADMQGGCFTISSLGSIGGQGFTPIVNAPEVAILGVSRAETKPVWDGAQFVPRLMLPLSLSYDHRAINGSDAGRFFTYMAAVLSDLRRLLL